MITIFCLIVLTLTSSVLLYCLYTMFRLIFAKKYRAVNADFKLSLDSLVMHPTLSFKVDDCEQSVVYKHPFISPVKMNVQHVILYFNHKYSVLSDWTFISLWKGMLLVSVTVLVLAVSICIF